MELSRRTEWQSVTDWQSVTAQELQLERRLANRPQWPPRRLLQPAVRQRLQQLDPPHQRELGWGPEFECAVVALPHAELQWRTLGPPHLAMAHSCIPKSCWCVQVAPWLRWKLQVEEEAEAEAEAEVEVGALWATCR